ncbi:WD40 repeat-like protein [Microthyrium microscopicum]|uniref:WD40 repeat-like protein n=1 Tax=Microthyrium microscopicum TaxID=703497 RepID=A0A6A6UTX1_9PEZI|nr:WD40 repeat-like protein [Microthyrium microscopicum]
MSTSKETPGSSTDQQPEKVCQISYTPATKTTVVTTTTTTTTSFPPFTLKAPLDLHQRDPKQYPLASYATPTSLRRFQFYAGDKMACFEETSLKPVAAQEGENKSESSTKVEYAEPIRTPRKYSAVSSQYANFEYEPSVPTSQKRAAPGSDTMGESDNEVEMGRPLKKVRKLMASALHHTPVTPHSQSTRRDRMFGSTGAGATQNSLVIPSSQIKRPTLQFLIPFDPQNTNHDSLDTLSPNTIAGPPSPPSFVQAPAMVATPPVADQDLEPIDTFGPSLDLESSQNTSPQPLELPSLPSPVLSPITAAASPEIPTLQVDEEEENTLDEQREASQALVKLSTEDMVRLSEPVGAEEGAPLGPMQDVSIMMNTFDTLPFELQRYCMFQLLRRSPKQLLQFVADIVNPALKCDFLTRLPTELALNVTRYLDATSLSRATQVSRRWRELIDSDDRLWADLIEQDGFVLPKGEVERAIREGWKWQGLLPAEIDIRPVLKPPTTTLLPLPSPASEDALRIITPMHRGIKRRSIAQESNNKRRKTNVSKEDAGTLIRSNLRHQATLSMDQLAEISDLPELGMKDLRIPHLYKSIYRRHDGFRKGWMDKNTKPHHLAFRAHGRHVVTCLQFDDEKILTGSDDTKIHVWDTNTGKLLKVLDGHEGGVWALQYEKNTLVSGSTDRTVRVWDIETGKCLHTFQGHTSTVRCLVILQPTVIGTAPDGSPITMPKEPLIITGSRDSSLRIWSLPKPGDPPFNPTGLNIMGDEMNPYFIRALNGHLHSVRAIAAHGDTLVSGSYDSTVRVWRISTGEVMHRLSGHTQKVYSVILDHQRNRCISGSMDNLVKVWSLETGQCIFNLEGHSSLVGLLDLNSGRLVSAAADWTLRVWDPETGHCKNILSAHSGAITCFQHDGQKVVSGSDRTLKMWNIQTGECVRDLLTDLSGGWQVKFNDRKCVAAVQRRNRTYIEVLDFGAARDGLTSEKLGSRILVDENGDEVEDLSDEEELDD